MKINPLPIRVRTTISQQLLDYCQEQIENSRKFVEIKLKGYNILDKKIINMDEVPLTFDMLMPHTVDTVGQKYLINIRTTGHEKANLTCVLAITAEGYKLPAMIIFNRKTVPNEKFPSGIVVKGNRKEWMYRDMMLVWLNSCYRQRPGGFFRIKKVLSIMDSTRAHLTEDIKKKVGEENIIPVIIQGGITKIL